MEAGCKSALQLKIFTMKNCRILMIIEWGVQLHFCILFPLLVLEMLLSKFLPGTKCNNVWTKAEGDHLFKWTKKIVLLQIRWRRHGVCFLYLHSLQDAFLVVPSLHVIWMQNKQVGSLPLPQLLPSPSPMFYIKAYEAISFKLFIVFSQLSLKTQCTHTATYTHGAKLHSVF